MRSIGIKALKSRLNDYVRAAAAGETVLVINRGRVIAKLMPPSVRGEATPDEQLLAELMRLGLLTPARVSPNAKLPRRRPVAKVASVLQVLEESRAER